MDRSNGFEPKREGRNGSERPGDVGTKLRRVKSALETIQGLCLLDGEPSTRLVRIALTAEHALRELEGEG